MELSCVHCRLIKNLLLYKWTVGLELLEENNTDTREVLLKYRWTFFKVNTFKQKAAAGCNSDAAALTALVPCNSERMRSRLSHRDAGAFQRICLWILICTRLVIFSSKARLTRRIRVLWVDWCITTCYSSSSGDSCISLPTLITLERNFICVLTMLQWVLDPVSYSLLCCAGSVRTSS